MDLNSGRYQRQVILPEIGHEGQARLARARVLVIGAGALGTPALYYLAAAGIGTVGIADEDTLELSNLHRQILYASDDLGRPKVEAAAERLRAFNPEVRIETHRLRADAHNIVELVSAYEVIIDATDRLETKFLINDGCAKAGRTLVHAAVLGFEARAAVFNARTGPCLRCLYPTPPEVPALTCSEAGVLGAVTGMTGSLQALEAIKWLLLDDETRPGTHPSLKTLLGRLWILDARTLLTRVIELPRDPECSICGEAGGAIALESGQPGVAEIAYEQLSDYTDTLLVDVREDEEWASGHLADAVHYPLSGLIEQLPELDTHERYVFYCAHGQRSLFAAKLFQEAGYRNTFSLAGGISACPSHALRP